MNDPKSEDQRAILLVSPVVTRNRIHVSTRVVSWDLAQGTKLAPGAESVDSSVNDQDKVSDTEKGHAAASTASDNRFDRSNANTNIGAGEDKEEESHGSVNACPF